MKCENCKKENPDDALFCWNCGEKLPPSKPQGKKNLDENETDILNQLNNLFNNN